jgi:hypothetical protein
MTRRAKATRPQRTSILTRIVLVVLALATVSAGAAVVVMAGPVPSDGLPRTVSVSALPSGSEPAAVRECGTATAVQPASLPLWCPSPEQHMDNLSWSKWGQSVTTATGDLRDTPCFCVGRAARDYPVTVALQRAGSRSVSQPYTLLTVSFPGDRPAWAFQARFTFQWTTSGYISKETNR